MGNRICGMHNRLVTPSPSHLAHIFLFNKSTYTDKYIQEHKYSRGVNTPSLVCFKKRKTFTLKILKITHLIGR